MESSTILSLLFGSSSPLSTSTLTTPITTTISPLKTITENNIMQANNNINENTVTSQLIISPSSSSSSSSLFNIINSSNDDIIKATTEYATSFGLADDIVTAAPSSDDIDEVTLSSAVADSAAAALDLWGDQQITFEIPSSNDLEKINNLDNFTNLFHRIINNAQQQQQQQQQQHNLIENNSNNNYYNNDDNNNNNRLFNTHTFDTNGSPVINLADLKTNLIGNDVVGIGGGSGGVSIANDLFNLNNFNGLNNNYNDQNNNINLLNDNNINNLENLLFGNVNMQNLINYLWIGVVTSLIILSVIFIIFSCYFYRKFKEWKKCNKDIRSQMTSTEFYQTQYGPNNNGITVCNGRVTGTNESGYFQMESPPCYTIATGLPSYDEALLYYTNNHHQHHHHHLLLHHNNHQYQKSLQCGNHYEKHKEFNYIFINDSATSNLSDNNFAINQEATNLNHNNNNNNNNYNNNNDNSYNSIRSVNSENQLTQFNSDAGNAMVTNYEISNNNDGVDVNGVAIKLHYPYDEYPGEHNREQQQLTTTDDNSLNEIQNQIYHHHNNLNKNSENKSCLKYFQQQQQQQKEQLNQEDFQMTESISSQQIISPAAVLISYDNNHETATKITTAPSGTATVLIKETNFQNDHSSSSIATVTEVTSSNETTEEIENCNNSNLNAEVIEKFSTTTTCHDVVVISCPMSMTNDNNYYDKISSNLDIEEKEEEENTNNSSYKFIRNHCNNDNLKNNNSNDNCSYDCNLIVIKNEDINLEGNCTDIVVMP